MYYELIPIHDLSEELEKYYKRHRVVSQRSIDELQGEGEYVAWEKADRAWRGRTLVRATEDHPFACTYRPIPLGELDISTGMRVCQEFPNQVIDRLSIGNVLGVSGDYLPYDAEGNLVHYVRGVKWPQIITREKIYQALKGFRRIWPKAFTDRLIYRYDYGDNWKIQITGSAGCSDLIEEGVITAAFLDKAVGRALEEQCPVLLAKDGDMLIEDVGGVRGFLDFLEFVSLPPDAVIRQRSDYIDPSEYDGEHI